MPEETLSKPLGKYKISFKTLFDNNNSNYIVLKVSLSHDLRQLIMSTILDDEVEYNLYNGSEEIALKRYKVKRWVFSSLNRNYRDSLFSKQLLDTGEAEFKFTSVLYLDDFMRQLKSNTKLLLQTIHDYSEINVTVNFNLEE